MAVGAISRDARIAVVRVRGAVILATTRPAVAGRVAACATTAAACAASGADEVDAVAGADPVANAAPGELAVLPVVGVVGTGHVGVAAGPRVARSAVAVVVQLLVAERVAAVQARGRTRIVFAAGQAREGGRRCDGERDAEAQRRCQRSSQVRHYLGQPQGRPAFSSKHVSSMSARRGFRWPYYERAESLVIPGGRQLLISCVRPCGSGSASVLTLLLSLPASGTGLEDHSRVQAAMHPEHEPVSALGAVGFVRRADEVRAQFGLHLGHRATDADLGLNEEVADHEARLCHEHPAERRVRLCLRREESPVGKLGQRHRPVEADERAQRSKHPEIEPLGRHVVEPDLRADVERLRVDPVVVAGRIGSLHDRLLDEVEHRYHSGEPLEGACRSEAVVDVQICPHVRVAAVSSERVQSQLVAERDGDEAVLLEIVVGCPAVGVVGSRLRFIRLLLDRSDHFLHLGNGGRRCERLNSYAQLVAPQLTTPGQHDGLGLCADREHPLPSLRQRLVEGCLVGIISGFVEADRHTGAAGVRVVRTFGADPQELAASALFLGALTDEPDANGLTRFTRDRYPVGRLRDLSGVDHCLAVSEEGGLAVAQAEIG